MYGCWAWKASGSGLSPLFLRNLDRGSESSIQRLDGGIDNDLSGLSNDEVLRDPNQKHKLILTMFDVGAPAESLNKKKKLLQTTKRG